MPITSPITDRPVVAGPKLDRHVGEVQLLKSCNTNVTWQVYMSHMFLLIAIITLCLVLFYSRREARRHRLNNRFHRLKQIVTRFFLLVFRLVLSINTPTPVYRGVASSFTRSHSPFSQSAPLIEKTHHFLQVIETVWTISDGSWAAISLRLSNIFTEYFPYTNPQVLYDLISSFFRKVKDSTDAPLSGVASGIFADAATALDSLEWISSLTNWHGILRHLLAHILVLPCLGLESLLEHRDFLHLIDRSAVESLQKGSPIKRIEDFTVVLKGFCTQLDNFLDPKPNSSGFMHDLSSVQGWAAEIQFLESNLGSRTHKPRAGCITYADFNLRVLKCEARKSQFSVSGPYNLIIGEACRRLANIKSAQICNRHPDPSTPFVIAISGVSGAGKSTIAKFISRHILRLDPKFKHLTDEDIDEMTFLTTPTSKWAAEGYNPEKHLIAVFEEIGTILDKNSPIHPFLLRIMESGTHQTDQASAHLKGKVPFTSKIIILLTNDSSFGLNQDPDVTKVFNSAAWFRRFSIHINAVSLNPKYTDKGKRVCDLNVAKTLNIANWNLMKNEGPGERIRPVPEVDDRGVPLTLNITTLMKTIEERRAITMGISKRAEELSHDSFSFYKCQNLETRKVVAGVSINNYDCTCCTRCPKCDKTSACIQEAVCSTDCIWHVPPGDDDLSGKASSSFLTPFYRDYVNRFGYLRGTFNFVKILAQIKFCEYSPLTSLGSAAYVSAALLGATQFLWGPLAWLLCGSVSFSPFSAAITFTIWLGMFAKPATLSNAVYDTLADAFETAMISLPIGFCLPQHQAYYASQFLKASSAVFCGIAFSSFPQYLYYSGFFWYFGSTALFPILHLGYMSFYTFICLKGFYNNPRFFGKNNDLNNWYHARRLRQLGIDPSKVHAGLTILITFVASYSLFRRVQRSTKKSPPKEDLTPDPSRVSISHSEGASVNELFVNEPFVDVHSTSRSFWGGSTEAPDWPKSQVPLDLLISKVSKAQVRLTIEDADKRTHVGGTCMGGSMVVSVYHALRDLNNPDATLTVNGVVNGHFQEISSSTSYSSDGVRCLSNLSKHIDETKDVFAVSVNKAPSVNLAKHVIRSYTGHAPFKAVVVHMTREGKVGVVYGSSRRTEQSITLDGSSTKLYTGSFYDFTPDSSSDFQSYGGICGGCMIMYTHTKCAIVGILAATFFAGDGANVVKRVGALPISEAGLDFSCLGTSIPASFPEKIRENSPVSLDIQPPFKEKYFHSTHAMNEGRIGSYGNTEVLGTVPGSVVYSSSSTKFYEWERELFGKFPEFRHSKIPPIMTGVKINGEYHSPGKNAILDLATPARNPILPYHFAAAENVRHQFDECIDIFRAYAPLCYTGDMSLSVSGLAGSELHTGVKRTTGAGFPYTGKKSDYFIYNTDNTVRLKKELLEQITSNFESYSEGNRLGFVTRASVKDEPRDSKKVAVRKIRVFSPSEFDKFLNIHILISSLVQLSLMARKITLTMGGMSVFTDEWSKLRSDREKEKPNCVVGDFSKFDKKTSLQTLLTSSNIDLSLIRESDYFKSLSPSDSEKFVRMYHTARCDSSNCLLLVDGELLNPGQSTSSGGADTFKQNGMSHKLDVREACLLIVKYVSDGNSDWLEHSTNRESATELANSLRELRLCDRLPAIFKHIDDITLGDDGCYAVSDAYIPLFHFHTFKLAYAKMGLTFTLPDKTLGTGSHVTWDEVDIGQRKFVWNEEVQAYLAPLSVSSIGKMLTIGVVKDMTIPEKRESAVKDATLEFAQHGREQYESWMNRLIPICTKWKVNIEFPDWLSVVTSNRTNRFYKARGENQAAVSAVQTALDTLYEVPREHKHTSTSSAINQPHSFNTPPMTSRNNTPTNSHDTLCITKSVASSDTSDVNHQEKISVSSNQSSENVTFLEEPMTYSLDLTSAPDSTFSETGASDCGLGGFLDRYVELESLQWIIGSDFLEVTDPWTQWRTNPRIAQKLAHYRYLKCNLEVKFIVNGTAFHYGQLMAAYAPMLSYWGKDFNVTATATANKDESSLYNFRHYGSSSGTKLKELTDSYFSTFPHIMIIPGDNSPVALKLPFIWHNNYLRVNKTDDTHAVGTGYETPGSIVLTDLVGLARSTDTASNSLTVSVWCRATDIDVNTPTAGVASSEEIVVSTSLEGIASSEVEQASSGFVSSLATGMAEFAHATAVIPGVKPYAKATEVAATSVASIAQLFGFSKPTDASSSHQMAVSNGRGIALTNTADTSQKLAFDAHQEITVDSRVIGGDGTDEMCFAALNQKWWWCAKVPWVPSASVGGATSYGFLASYPDLLYRCLVSPTMWRRFQTNHTSSRHAWQLNPAGYLANTFNFWRGSVTYRIQVVASKFHTGRIKIQFDPSNGDETKSDVETRYTWILDLSEASEIDVTIPYTAFRSYLDKQPLSPHGLQDPEYSDTVVATTKNNFDERKHTGFLSISIVNHLVSPNGTEGKVHLSVWQRCENDTEYQVPGSVWHNNILKATGASEVETVDTEDLVCGSSSPIEMWHTSPNPDRTSVWFGERVLSIRSLIKRFSYANTLTSEVGNNGSNLNIFTIPHWPSVSQTNWGLKNTYVSYFSPCYLAKRGGMRYKSYFWQVGSGTGTPNSAATDTSTQAERLWSSSYVGYSSQVVNLNGDSALSYDQNVAGGASGGLLLGAGLGDKLVEVESPFYQNVRFQLAQFFGNANSPIDVGNNYVRITKKAYMNASVSGRLSIYQAAAEDTSFMYFLAAPVLYET